MKKRPFWRLPYNTNPLLDLVPLEKGVSLTIRGSGESFEVLLETTRRLEELEDTV